MSAGSLAVPPTRGALAELPLVPCAEGASVRGHSKGWEGLVLFFFSPRRLGHKLEGVLCDGASDEVVASTVVNCTRIDESE